MPFASVVLRPGVDVQKTQSLNEAGVSQSQLIRFKDDLIQSYGGWSQFTGLTYSATARDIHPWQELDGDKFLGIGGTNNLSVLLSSINLLSDISPQITTTNPSPAFSISSGSATVTVIDPNIATTTYDTVYFNTPVSIGNVFLSGAYPIVSVLSTGSYTITSGVAASTTIVSSGILPTFALSSGSANVIVTLPNNNYQRVTGLFYPFIAETSAAGQTIGGNYTINSIIDSTQFTINLSAQSSATVTATMNSGNAQLAYYITLGPQQSGGGYGSGGYGLGGYGTGTTVSGSTGSVLTSADWTLDNWGDLLVACPTDGPIFVWGQSLGTVNAQVVQTAPFTNGGVFVAMPQQILVAWRSVQSSSAQDNLMVRWSDQEDYTNWTISNQTLAGAFHLPTGSLVVGGIQGPTVGVISTDVDVWVMQYVGGDAVFNFTRVGTGCGWIGPHAAGSLGGTIYWCGFNNFYRLGATGVESLPCPVWDKIFQNLNVTYQNKVLCAVNSAFDEIAWFYPSLNATECDSYVKMQVTSRGVVWDYGTLSRTAWTDISTLGYPIGIDASGTIWQHESGNAFPGANNPSFQTGWWAITDGHDLAFVDFVIPDFIWGTSAGAKDANISITFFAVDYPGDTPRSYGPYVVTQATEYLSPRIRGRLMSALIQLNNSEFFRIGRIRYRWQPSGQR